MRSRIDKASLLAICLLLLPAVAFAQGKKGEDENVRMVQGTVTDADDKPVAGAVVQLKNTKSLQIRSFITREEGTYYFHGLDQNVDYELKADHQGASSSVRTLSSFDSRKKPVINLKIESKK